MNYWLSPTGRAWASKQIGCHYPLALEIMAEKFPYDLETENFDNPVEFLEDRGFIRYCDWGAAHSWVLRPGKRPTKKQIEKAYLLTNEIIS